MIQLPIPMRPQTERAFDLTQEEQNCLSYYVLSGCSQGEAFKTFVRPDLAVSKLTLGKAAKQFFACKDAIIYIEEYTNTIKRLFDIDAQAETAEEQVELRRKDREVTKRKLFDFVSHLSKNIDQADDPESIIKMADKLGLLDNEMEEIKPPQRYLPISECGRCRYFIFCESDEVVDECKRCKYRKYANENGVKYTHKTQLDKE